MFVGKVIGTVWSTVKWPQVQGLKLLVVRPYHLADLADLGDLPNNLAQNPTNSRGGAAANQSANPDAAPNPHGGPDSEAVVCVDLLDAGVGDDVVVAFGHAARVAAQLQDAAPGQKGQGPPSGQSGQNGQNGQTGTIVPIDAAVVAIVDSIRVARPLT